jgi:TonB-dependent receptor
MIIVSSVFVLAASSNIKGRITDSTTGDGLLGANVVLAGTSMGSATDLDGMYLIPNVPSGSYTLRISYIGYKTEEIKIEVKDGESVKKDIKLNSVSIEGQTITITAQASGQNSSINQQLSSNKIVNVVSSDRIQELPDVNAAESVGRLPGVSVTRSGGEANGVIIRGLQPKYNMIMIDGVEMAATNSGDRSTDLSMISSNSLSGIEVYKTLTPDMDAATLGGVVNFEIREAKSSPTGAPLIELQAQGGYTDLVSSFGNYKFIGSIENRYFNDNLGVFVQVIAEKLNHTDDELGGSYMQPYPVEQPNLVALKNLDISFNPLDKRRYDATLVLDYKLPDGKISLMNLFSSGKTVTTNFDQIYNSGSSNSISYNIGYTNNTLNAFTNILHYQQTLFSIKVDAKLSNSYSENHDPQDWNMDFWQNAAGIGNINNGAGPVEFAKEANAHLNINPRDNTYGMFFDAFNVSNSFTKQQNIAGSIDLERTFNFSDMITAIFKAGVQLKYTSRWHSENSSRAGLYYPAAKNSREAVAAAFPWMTQAPYYVKADGSSQL